MKAIQFHEYGTPDVLQLKEVDKPAPKEHQVLVKIHAASLNALDWRSMRADPFIVRLDGGLRKPKNPFLGADLAGTVEAVGTAVTQFKPGNEVFGACGSGSFAEYVCTSHKNVALKPANISFEAAAAVPVAGLTALQGLRDKGKIQPGQKVLINGAGGGVGMFAVQIAKAFGGEVTAVCSTRNVDIVRQIGADHVIDYTRQDWTKNGQRYDLITAANGYHSLLTYWRTLNPNGTYVVLGGAMAQIFQGMILGSLVSKLGRKTMTFLYSQSNQDDLICLKEMLEASKIIPVIDRCYPLTETAEAVRYLEQGHTQGKVVIAVT